MVIKPGIEGHIWANEYDRDWKDIFSVQSEVTQNIARELQAVITPEEKQLIEKIPTANLTAYDFFQRGRAEHVKYLLNRDNIEAQERAEDFYNKAIEYDSSFAQAYTGLTMISLDNNILDSILIRTDAALSLDDQVEEAYYIRAVVYRFTKRKNNIRDSNNNQN